MKDIKRLMDWVLATSIYTACCATGLCLATERLIKADTALLTAPLHILVFGSTLVIYNAPRIFRKPFADELSGPPWRNNRFWYFIIFGAGSLLTAYSLINTRPAIIALCLVLGVLALAYSLPLLPFGRRRRIRDYGWLKILVLTCVWTIATSILPMLYWKINPALYPYEVVLRLLFIFSLCMIFDIRDITTDKAGNIATLPQRLGLGTSYTIIAMALLAFCIAGYLQYLHYPSSARLFATLVTGIATWAITAFLRRWPTQRGYLILADGVMLIYALLTMLPK